MPGWNCQGGFIEGEADGAQDSDSSSSVGLQDGPDVGIESGLPPGRPSVITRVLGVDNGWLRVGQARRARSRQIA